MCACSEGQLLTVQCLVANACKLNVRDKVTFSEITVIHNCLHYF